MTEETTFRLMYRSRSRLAPDRTTDELGDLFTTARSHNNQRGITGALLLSGDRFVQVLEGEEGPVRSLFARIQHDPRHDGVELLRAEWTAEPVFARWSMASVAADAADGESDLPLIAVVGEFSPAAPRRTTPAQDQLLGAMRQAATGAPGT